jgi:hypothetical protein
MRYLPLGEFSPWAWCEFCLFCTPLALDP